MTPKESTAKWGRSPGTERQTHAEFREVRVGELGDPNLDDYAAMFRAAQDYAAAQGYVGGLPTLTHRQKQFGDWRQAGNITDTMCVVVLFSSGVLILEHGSIRYARQSAVVVAVDSAWSPFARCGRSTSDGCLALT